MGAELWMSSMQTEGDHTTTLVIVGEGGALRTRLVEAVERLGYQVIADQAAIVARRGARGMGSSGCSLDIRDYPTELIVTLKPKGETSTLATFNFTVKNYYYWTRGDRRTLELEAGAIAALASTEQSVAACAACGTETTDDSRFCRRCGAPLLAGEPAELEFLRLTAGARAGHKNIVAGSLVLLVTAVVSFLLLWLGTTQKSLKAAEVIAAMGLVGGLMTLLTGAWRLHRSLNPPSAEDAKRTAYPAESARVFASTRATAALPPRSAQSSVTEGTTELLGREGREHAPVEVHRRDGDTGPIN